jgi:hypothetical protein
MITKSAVAALVTCLALMVAPAYANGASWAYTQDGEDEDAVYIAFQHDRDGIEFGVDCTAFMGDYSIYLFTDEHWEATTSYAPEVPVTFTINGTDHTATFGFEHNDKNELIVAEYEMDNADEVNALMEALREATGTIRVSYFTTSRSFEAAGVGDALGKVDEACWGP